MSTETSRVDGDSSMSSEMSRAQVRGLSSEFCSLLRRSSVHSTGCDASSSTKLVVVQRHLLMIDLVV